MSVNGVTTSQTTDYSAYSSTAAKQKTAEEEKTKSDAAAVYDKSPVSKMGKSEREALVQKLKRDSQNRIAQMESLVTKMFQKQGQTVGTADSMWKMLASGNFTADPETIRQAKEDISEDGYWGVSQTSDRIFDFAMALSGGDLESMKKMQEAFEKGFAQATGAWGRELPDISSQTHDAVTKKFEDYYAQYEVEG